MTTEISTKQQIVEAMQSLPEETTYEEAMDRLYVLYKIQKAGEDSKAGRTFTHEEVRKRFAEWLT